MDDGTSNACAAVLTDADIGRIILRLLDDPRAILRLASTCHAWAVRVASANQVWQALCYARWPATQHLPSVCSFRKLFRNHALAEAPRPLLPPTTPPASSYHFLLHIVYSATVDSLTAPFITAAVPGSDVKGLSEALGTELASPWDRQLSDALETEGGIAWRSAPSVHAADVLGINKATSQAQLDALVWSPMLCEPLRTMRMSLTLLRSHDQAVRTLCVDTPLHSFHMCWGKSLKFESVPLHEELDHSLMVEARLFPSVSADGWVFCFDVLRMDGDGTIDTVLTAAQICDELAHSPAPSRWKC